MWKQRSLLLLSLLKGPQNLGFGHGEAVGQPRVVLVELGLTAGLKVVAQGNSLRTGVTKGGPSKPDTCLEESRALVKRTHKDKGQRASPCFPLSSCQS